MDGTVGKNGSFFLDGAIEDRDSLGMIGALGEHGSFFSHVAIENRDSLHLFVYIV